MTSKLLLSALLLTATPCVFAQQGPPPDGSAPVVRPHDHAGRPDDRGRGPMPSQGMRGQDGPGGEHGEHGGHMMHGMPDGPWWRSPEVAARIGLTADQRKRIDDIFLQTRVQLIDMHASLEKEQLLLEPLLNANPVDQTKALAQIGKIADTRAELEKTDAKMLLGIRGVLNADQWTKLRERHGFGEGRERATAPQ